MLPSIKRLESKAVFQHSNALKSSDKNTRDLIFDYPNMSSDFNPIENLEYTEKKIGKTMIIQQYLPGRMCTVRLGKYSPDR